MSSMVVLRMPWRVRQSDAASSTRSTLVTPAILTTFASTLRMAKPDARYTGDAPTLPTPFAVGRAAATTVGQATLAAARLWATRQGWPSPPPVSVDVREAAAAFRSERYLRVDGRAPVFA